MGLKGYHYPTKDELSYTTTEQSTGLTWIDGSEIYKKTIYVDTLPNNGVVRPNHNISSIGMVVRISGIMVNATGDQFWHIPYQLIDIVEVNTNTVTIQSKFDARTYKAYVTVYYTKGA